MVVLSRRPYKTLRPSHGGMNLRPSSHGNVVFSMPVKWKQSLDRKKPKKTSRRSARDRAGYKLKMAYFVEEIVLSRNLIKARSGQSLWFNVCFWCSKNISSHMARKNWSVLLSLWALELLWSRRKCSTMEKHEQESKITSAHNCHPFQLASCKLVTRKTKTLTSF